MHSPLPLISIIVPVYNTHKYITKCINSIIHQTYKKLEIIIINDGSTDNSLELCNSFAKLDGRIILISQLNKGLSGALNTGLANANGDWLMFVDSDDWIELDTIESLVEKIILYPKLDLIRSYNRAVDCNGNILSKPQDIKEEIFNREGFLKSNMIGGFISSLFVRRYIVNHNSLIFSEELEIKMDLTFTWQCVLNSNDILVTNKVFYNYLQRDDSLIHTMSLSKIMNHLKASELVYQYSLNFDNLVVRTTANRYLNNGLQGFIDGISRISVQDNTITAKEVRKTLIDFLKNCHLKIHNLNIKNIVFTMFIIVDFRILVLIRKIINK